MVEFLDGGGHRVHHIRQPFMRGPGFWVTSVNYGTEEPASRGKIMVDSRGDAETRSQGINFEMAGDYGGEMMGEAFSRAFLFPNFSSATPRLRVIQITSTTHGDTKCAK